MWPRVRAAIIALALVLAAIDGLPLPKPERAERLPPLLRGAVARVAAIQAGILAPIRPLADALVVSQRWSLFAGASQDRFRLVVEGRSASDATFRPFYRADDPRHAELADTIEYRRVRGAFNPRTREPPAGYDAFAAFVARRLFSAHPRLAEVRVRLEAIRIRERGRGYAGTGTFVHERLRKRSEVMP
jgi:hypothetical protein